MREAVSDLLPFSQIGGIVIGTRTLTTAGIPASEVYASLVVDMTTEMGAQLVFTLFGLSDDGQPCSPGGGRRLRCDLSSLGARA